MLTSTKKIQFSILVFIQTNSRSVTPSPLPSPNATIRPPPAAPVQQQQQQQRTRGLTSQGAPNQTQNPNTLHPLGMFK